MAINIVKGDITQLKVDAIVNAANNSLLGGGGVDGAIHKAAGSQLLEACKLLNGCETGSVKATDAYNLQAKYVLHTVGPIWKNGQSNEEILLRSCYFECLTLANKLNCTSIAFPNISTGVYGFPKELAAEIAYSTITNFLKSNSLPKDIHLICFDDENFHIYSEKHAHFRL